MAAYAAAAAAAARHLRGTANGVVEACFRLFFCRTSTLKGRHRCRRRRRRQHIVCRPRAEYEEDYVPARQGKPVPVAILSQIGWSPHQARGPTLGVRYCSPPSDGGVCVVLSGCLLAEVVSNEISCLLVIASTVVLQAGQTGSLCDQWVEDVAYRWKSSSGDMKASSVQSIFAFTTSCPLAQA